VTTPLISVCLPNLNTFPYLRERIETILGQTYSNWELIVSDNFSDDGAWELFEEFSGRDPRISIAQAPREGMYQNWNRCLERARGEYVYIATSDDGMAPDCLEKLVLALERHPECDAAHCSLVVVDEKGTPLTDRWWRRGLFDQSLPDLADHPHVRYAPYDGLLCLTGEQVYYSITEWLFRRSLFARIGVFQTRWDSVGDFNWYMRVGLAANIVHVPGTWASWRVHAKQATDYARLRTVDHQATVDEMIRAAVISAESHLPPAVAEGLRSRWLDESREMRAYYRGLGQRSRALDRRMFQLAKVVDGAEARSEMIRRMLGQPRWPDTFPDQMRSWLSSLGLRVAAADLAAGDSAADPALAGG
jgi:glycosyltransferase involved in cell wall biosynthesis